MRGIRRFIVPQTRHGKRLLRAYRHALLERRLDHPTERFRPGDPTLHIVNLQRLLELHIKEQHMGRLGIGRCFRRFPGEIRDKVHNTANLNSGAPQNHALVVQQFTRIIVQLNHALLIPVRDNAPIQVFVGRTLRTPVLEHERLGLYVSVIVQMLPDRVAPAYNRLHHRVGNVERRNRQPGIPGILHFRARIQALDAGVLKIHRLIIVGHFRARGLLHDVHRADVRAAFCFKIAGDHALHLRLEIV